MRDFLARVGSLRMLYRYPCPHSTKLYFVCQTICRLSTPFVNLVLVVLLIVLDVGSVQDFFIKRKSLNHNLISDNESYD